MCHFTQVSHIHELSTKTAFHTACVKCRYACEMRCEMLLNQLKFGALDTQKKSRLDQVFSKHL